MSENGTIPPHLYDSTQIFPSNLFDSPLWSFCYTSTTIADHAGRFAQAVDLFAFLPP